MHSQTTGSQLPRGVTLVHLRIFQKGYPQAQVQRMLGPHQELLLAHSERARRLQSEEVDTGDLLRQ